MAVMIETKNLTYIYPAPEGETNPPALRGVSVTIEKGSFTVVLGHNGSGKTTLLRCLNFLETADAGQLILDGESFDLAHANRADIARLRKKLGWTDKQIETVFKIGYRLRKE